MKARKPTGAVIYSGPSRIDGRPIFVVATTKSTNAKTGNIVQTWILCADVDPVAAVKSRQDSSICGGCVHRGKTPQDRTCYVQVGRAPLTVYRTWQRGRYPIAPDVAAIGRGRMVRLGSYGDPAAVPMEVWTALVSESTGHAGYTHQWKSAKLRDVTSLCMASADSTADLGKARKLGLRTFRVRSSAEPLQTGEVICPASAEAGKVATCATCRQCFGTNGQADPSIAIMAHGVFTGRFERGRLPVLT